MSLYSPGEIVGFWSDEANKHKYHLCISDDGEFLFLNSPKPRRRPSDLYLSCDKLPGLPPTDTGESIISCSLVMKKTDTELRSARAKKLGDCSSATLKALVKFVEDNPALSDEDKEKATRGLADWL